MLCTHWTDSSSLFREMESPEIPPPGHDWRDAPDGGYRCLRWMHWLRGPISLDSECDTGTQHHLRSGTQTRPFQGCRQSLQSRTRPRDVASWFKDGARNQSAWRPVSSCCPGLCSVFVPRHRAAGRPAERPVETKPSDSLMRSTLYASYTETLTGRSTIRAYTARSLFKAIDRDGVSRRDVSRKRHKWLSTSQNAVLNLLDKGHLILGSLGNEANLSRADILRVRADNVYDTKRSRHTTLYIRLVYPT
ncbi:unnamed protein product [Mycena citricolor]|uniref:Uncharacterized protein n=1 Tax=Mycena citricolor TaxID=2018698 RepID=A0AAD2H700_9AGAR|nr:unnamed protein product [Mycena citricolor]